MSICQCLIQTKKQTNVVGIMGGLIKFAQKALTYQLKDNDINHIIDMAEFYKKYEDLCATDVTSKFLYKGIL